MTTVKDLSNTEKVAHTLVNNLMFDLYMKGLPIASGMYLKQDLHATVAQFFEAEKKRRN